MQAVLALLETRWLWSGAEEAKPSTMPVFFTVGMEESPPLWALPMLVQLPTRERWGHTQLVLQRRHWALLSRTPAFSYCCSVLPVCASGHLPGTRASAGMQSVRAAGWQGLAALAAQGTLGGCAVRRTSQARCFKPSAPQPPGRMRPSPWVRLDQPTCPAACRAESSGRELRDPGSGQRAEAGSD